tara:strand:- start:578 stop:1438 length:861 start_codon:yes stop_codon:yes gene_type:complete
MGPLAKFLMALTNLVRTGNIKKVSDAIRFAKQEFGEVSPLLTKQIEKIFQQFKKPKVGEPGKKEGAVVPFKKTEGIETLDDKGLTDSPLDDLKKIIEDSGGTAKTRDEVLRDEMLKDEVAKTDELMDFFQKEIDKSVDSKENIMGAIDKLKNPRRAGGPLDPVMGVTRTLARRVLEKRGINIDRREDPIDIFINTFGESITDLKNLGEDIVEAEQTGRRLKPMDDLLEIEGFFDIKIPKNPDRGIPTEEIIQKLEKDLKEKEVLENFDPKDRKPNAEGGLNYLMGL